MEKDTAANRAKQQNGQAAEIGRTRRPLTATTCRRSITLRASIRDRRRLANNTAVEQRNQIPWFVNLL
jgi:hypothetical protein